MEEHCPDSHILQRIGAIEGEHLPFRTLEVAFRISSTFRAVPTRKTTESTTPSSNRTDATGTLKRISKEIGSDV